MPTMKEFILTFALLLLSATTFFVPSSSAQLQIEWERRDLRLPNSEFILYSRDITVGPDGTVWLATNGRWVARSTDEGESWDTLGNGLHKQEYIQSVFVSRNGTLYAGGSRGLARSTDNGATFTIVAAENSNVEDIVEGKKGELYIATLGGVDGVYRSVDSGMTWARAPLNDSDIYSGVFSLAIGPDGAIFAAALKGLFVSHDSARTFSLVADSLKMGSNIYTVRCAPNGTLFAGGDWGMFRSLDSGRTWLRCSPIAGIMMPVLISPKGHIFAGIPVKGLYRSIDNGTTWQPVNGKAMPGEAEVKAFGHLAMAPNGRLFGLTLWQHMYRTRMPAASVKAANTNNDPLPLSRNLK